MRSTVQIGVIGELDDAFRPHIAIREAIEHAARAIGLTVGVEWIPTDAWVGDQVVAALDRFDGIWAAPCPRPYRSLDGGLAAIRFARDDGRPFLGT